MSKTAERTHPELWETVKAEVKESERGGKPGEWSARKAQLAVQEYKKRGGGYRGGKEEWGAKSGKPGGETGEHYLPREAQGALSEEEYRAPTQNTREDSRKSTPFSRQPQAIAVKTAPYRDAAKAEPKPEPTKGDLLRQAKMLEIEGRSRMSKEELAEAIRYAKH